MKTTKTYDIYEIEYDGRKFYVEFETDLVAPNGSKQIDMWLHEDGYGIKDMILGTIIDECNGNLNKSIDEIEDEMIDYLYIVWDSGNNCFDDYIEEYE